MTLKGLTTFQIGDWAEANVLAALIHLGYQVAKPCCSSSPWDIAIVWDDRLIRIQIKHAQLKNGVIVFPTRASRHNGPTYSGLCELIVVYCPNTMQCYAVRPEDAPSKSMSLRIDPPKNRMRISRRKYTLKTCSGQQKNGINMASKFFLKEVLALFISKHYDEPVLEISSDQTSKLAAAV